MSSWEESLIRECNELYAVKAKLEAQVEKLTKERDEARKDCEDAAGELMVDLKDAPPGSLVAKLLIANRILSRKLESA